MKKEGLRIIFMGTPDFAVANLKALVEAEYHIVGVITAPDKPAGRGRKLNQSAVKVYAETKNLNILQPTNLKDQDFVLELEELQANLQIIVAFRMLPKVVWAMPEYGTFNLHASLLPQYRGAAPIHWAIINGETKTGVTTFFIDDKIDTGAVILQEEIDIDSNETVGSLHDKLMTLGSQLVLKTVNEIEEGQVKKYIQSSDNNLNTAPKLDNDSCKLDWDTDVEKVYNKIRGLNPFPAAWCYLQNGNENLRIKVFDVDFKKEAHNHPPGKISLGKNELHVAAKNGFIEMKTIQLPGRRKMEVQSLLNGYDIEKGSKML